MAWERRRYPHIGAPVRRSVGASHRVVRFGWSCRRVVFKNLIDARCTDVFTLSPGPGPFRDVYECGLQIPARSPLQALAGFRDIQPEMAGFVRMLPRLQVPSGVTPPSFAQALDDPLHRSGIGLGRTE